MTNDQRAATAPERRDGSRLPVLAILVVGVVAVIVVAGTVSLLTFDRGSAAPELRSRVADAVVSVEQAGAAWDVGLESGHHVTLDSSVRDVFRPVSGPPLSPSVGDLMLADSLPPTWVAFSLGGGGQPGSECFEIHERAVVDGNRLVFTAGLSVPIGTWRRGAAPAQGASLGGACLDRQGRAVDVLLAPGFAPRGSPY